MYQNMVGLRPVRTAAQCVFVFLSDWWNTLERVLLGTADSLKPYLFVRTVNMYVQACCAMTHREAT